MVNGDIDPWRKETRSEPWGNNRSKSISNLIKTKSIKVEIIYLKLIINNKYTSV